MAAERIGEVLKGEGPLRTQDGVVIPFEFRNKNHRLALSNQELDDFAVRSFTRTSYQDNINLEMPGLDRVFIHSTKLLNDSGALNMVTQISSFTDSPYTGVAFNVEGRYRQGWQLRDIEKVPDITLMTWVVDRMTSKVLERQVAQKRRDIKNRETELLDNAGVPKPLDIYA
ncbi:MAG: hypothetical protein Q7T74_01390 [Candidatus Saccharibacteria bacterium]|nr:hypothetical protein [Candidatus Saccharibacteria bacterium]